MREEMQRQTGMSYVDPTEMPITTLCFPVFFTKGSSFAFLDNAGKTFSPRGSNLLATNSASPIPLSKIYLP